MSVPRPEHPRPQFIRPDWLSLNGAWQFEIDSRDAGLQRGFVERPFSREIVVPFCPESSLSGVAEQGFMPAVWYRRTLAVPAEWSGRRVMMRFQAVDYESMVWIDGVEAGRHRGGFTPFAVELPADAPGRAVEVVVRARDDPREAKPRGKQSPERKPSGVLYQRTTGIWQTVWLEAIPQAALGRPRITPDVAGSSFQLTQPLDLAVGEAGRRPHLAVRATLSDAAGAVASATAGAAADFSPRLDLHIPPERRSLWAPDHPHLYQLRIELLHGATVVDRIDSYAGLRGISLDGPAFRINGEAVFQRLVLDQGQYPDGVLTASSDKALRSDIELAQAAGFNGARLHQKVFEERFLFHADQLGYLVWGEFPDWGWADPGPDPTYITQWLEAIERDYSHPSIVGWCGLNETRQPPGDGITVLEDVTRGMFLAAKAADHSRPVLDASGYSHLVPETDVLDCHDYEQDPAEFAARFAQLPEGKPFFVSEFGGAWSSLEGHAGWGYGERPSSGEELHRRFEGLCGALLENPRMFGYCYTQLTDVMQEQNGIYTALREPKFDIARIAACQRRRAAVEAG